MNYGLHMPPQHLRNLVRYFWIYESDASDSMPAVHQAMADCCPELIFQYGGGFKEYNNYTTYLRAPRSVSKELHLADRMGLFAIRFYPHAIHHLLGIPNSELVNRSFEFTDIFGKSHSTINQQIMDAPTVEGKIRVATTFLTALSASVNKDPIDVCIRLMLLNEGNISLDTVRSYTGLSVKQFERRFKATSGFPPKYYARITRFQATKRKYVTGKFRTLSELSHACEYYDQSHFIREFKEFSGMQANQFFKLVENENTNESKVLRNLILAKDNP
jgi:AraC-like DNA-binding protein